MGTLLNTNMDSKISCKNGKGMEPAQRHLPTVPLHTWKFHTHCWLYYVMIMKFHKPEVTSHPHELPVNDRQRSLSSKVFRPTFFHCFLSENDMLEDWRPLGSWCLFSTAAAGSGLILLFFPTSSLRCMYVIETWTGEVDQTAQVLVSLGNATNNNIRRAFVCIFLY